MVYLFTSLLVKKNFRCNCPITSALDIIGDKWMLVIIKQMLLQDKKTFKDFIESDEAIATNILSIKLKQLEEFGFIKKSQLPTNKKSIWYHLTEKGLSLTPLIVELALWSDLHLRDLHANMAQSEELHYMREEKQQCIQKIQDRYRASH